MASYGVLRWGSDKPVSGYFWSLETLYMRAKNNGGYDGL